MKDLNRKSIILAGFPSSGKSYFGKKLFKELEIPFIEELYEEESLLWGSFRIKYLSHYLRKHFSFSQRLGVKRSFLENHVDVLYFYYYYLRENLAHSLLSMTPVLIFSNDIGYPFSYAFTTSERKSRFLLKTFWFFMEKLPRQRVYIFLKPSHDVLIERWKNTGKNIPFLFYDEEFYNKFYTRYKLLMKKLGFPTMEVDTKSFSSAYKKIKRYLATHVTV